MKHELCQTFVKYLMLFFNLVFILLSIVLIFIGILVYRKIDDFKLLLPEEISKYTLFLAFFGSVLCAISCHGSYCVFTRNKHVLTAFVILMVSLIMFEMIIVVYLKITYTGLLDDVPERLARTFAKSKKNQRYRDLWQTLQTNFKCCGLKTADDWRPIMKNDYFPLSCCLNLKNDTMCLKEFVLPLSCQWVLMDYCHTLDTVYLTVGLLSIVLQLAIISLTVRMYFELERLRAIEAEYAEDDENVVGMCINTFYRNYQQTKH